MDRTSSRRYFGDWRSTLTPQQRNILNTPYISPTYGPSRESTYGIPTYRPIAMPSTYQVPQQPRPQQLQTVPATTTNTSMDCTQCRNETINVPVTYRKCRKIVRSVPKTVDSCPSYPSSGSRPSSSLASSSSLANNSSIFGKPRRQSNFINHYGRFILIFFLIVLILAVAYLLYLFFTKSTFPPWSKNRSPTTTLSNSNISSSSSSSLAENSSSVDYFDLPEVNDPSMYIENNFEKSTTTLKNPTFNNNNNNLANTNLANNDLANNNLANNTTTTSYSSAAPLANSANSLANSLAKTSSPGPFHFNDIVKNRLRQDDNLYNNPGLFGQETPESVYFQRELPSPSLMSASFSANVDHSQPAYGEVEQLFSAKSPILDHVTKSEPPSSSSSALANSALAKTYSAKTYSAKSSPTKKLDNLIESILEKDLDESQRLSRRQRRLLQSQNHDETALANLAKDDYLIEQLLKDDDDEPSSSSFLANSAETKYNDYNRYPIVYFSGDSDPNKLTVRFVPNVRRKEDVLYVYHLDGSQWKYDKKLDIYYRIEKK